MSAFDNLRAALLSAQITHAETDAESSVDDQRRLSDFMKRVNWNSALHPRDALGRFAVSSSTGGGKPSSSARGRKLQGTSSREEILQGKSDTQALHAQIVNKKTYYSKSRKPLHDKIVDKYRSDATPVKKPRAVFMAGGSGSGKSSIRSQNPEWTENTVLADPDEIKALLPEFDQLSAIGDKWSASAVHEESSDVTKRIVYETLNAKQNLLLDGVGNSEPGKFAGKIQQAIDEGYDAKVVYATVSADEAWRRVQQRAIDRPERGLVPEKEVRSNHSAVSQRALELLEANPGDPGYGVEVEVHDTSGPGFEAKVIFKRERSETGELVDTVFDEEAFREFLSK